MVDNAAANPDTPPDTPQEARGEIRGGRFAGAFLGEQFALPEALDLLRWLRRQGTRIEDVQVSAADPLNLAGILLAGPRVGATSAGVVRLRLEAGLGAGK